MYIYYSPVRLLETQPDSNAYIRTQYNYLAVVRKSMRRRHSTAMPAGQSVTLTPATFVSSAWRSETGFPTRRVENRSLKFDPV